MTPTDDMLPRFYDELVHIDKLERDPEINPRNYTPTEGLVRRIKRSGMRHPLICRESPDGSDIFLIGDGYQRYQLAVDELDWDSLPCMIYPDDDFVQYVADVTDTSENRGWTRFQKWRTAVNTFHNLKDRGYSREKALEETLESSGAKRKADVEKWVKRFELPPSVLHLLKEPKERDEKSVATTLGKYSDTDFNRAKLHVRVADILADEAENLSTRKITKIASKAAGVRHQKGRSEEEVIEIVEEAVNNPHKSIDDIEKEVCISGSLNRSVLRVSNPSFNIGEDNVERFDRCCRNSDRTYNELIEEILKSVDYEEIFGEGKILISAD